MEYKYVIGKCNYENKGLVNLAEVEWKLDGGNFSASGGIWNTSSGSRRDYVTCGQILKELLSLFPEDQLLQRIVGVWEKWHLNDLKAGSPRQEEFLSTKNAPKGDHYEWAIQELTDAGLNPDSEYLYQDSPYKYGSAWLKAELPSSVIAEIESWSCHSGVTKK
jgi:hypothetical protein